MVTPVSWGERLIAETSVTWAYRLIFTAIVIAMAYLAWLHFSAPKAPVGAIVAAKVAPQAVNIPKVVIHPKAVKVYHASAKKALPLPQAVIDDKNVQLIEATRVESDDHPHTISTVINTETGETTTFDRREPLPWVTLRRSGALGLEHDLFRGIDTLYVRQDFVQVKSVVIEGKLAYNSERSGEASIIVEWRY
jgi:hypothetical protein